MRLDGAERTAVSEALGLGILPAAALIRGHGETREDQDDIYRSTLGALDGNAVPIVTCVPFLGRETDD